MSGFSDDLGSRSTHTLDQLVDTRRVFGIEAENALAAGQRGNLVVTYHPAETLGGNQHDASAVVECEL